MLGVAGYLKLTTVEQKTVKIGGTGSDSLNLNMPDNIPYRYEYPLYLEGYGKIHPDFMALNVNTRTVFYWEHMGMMDDTEYVENAIRRIEAYEKNDIFPGENLILTYETQRHPMSPRVIEQKIRKYLQ